MKDKSMDDTIRVFSGRTFSPEDIETIIWVTRTYSKLSKTEMASTVCELIGWVTPAGRPKRLQCAAYLDVLEANGLIELPVSKAVKRTGGRFKANADTCKQHTTGRYNGMRRHNVGTGR
ncbi:hypothetical protein [Muricomes intestini]|uniref:hypothetical protein n=1 Tax=Muricomes intestini TaxID=1796634 RepID=UPI002FE42A36